MMTAGQAMTGRALSGLLPELAATRWAALPVAAITADSRCVSPGSLFLAMPGGRADGRAFVDAAIRAGAVAVLAEEGDGFVSPRLVQGVPVIPVAHLRQRAGDIASAFHDHPSRALPVAGVTGTNGKTTVTQLAARLESALGGKGAVVGTLGWGIPGQLQATNHTTPDAIALQGMLAGLREAQASAVFMEVSSHALDQARVQGVRFETAAFTNLTRDHLDYHAGMEAYGEAKARLFALPGLKHAIINADDGFGRRLLAQLPAGVQGFAYGLEGGPADIRAVDAVFGADGMQAHIVTPWGEGDLQTRLLGRFNLSNILAVIGLLALRGHALADILRALAAVEPVSGRLERMAGCGDITVVVDYAHTPDALENALQTLRAHTTGRLHVVFGCGGDRDAGKRPLMGRVASQLADCVWLTSDNPRHEDPHAILQAIQAGLQPGQAATVIEDRTRAIHAALDAANAGDTVLIAGKGHETYQQVGDEKRPFSDQAAVHAWCVKKTGEGRA